MSSGRSDGARYSLLHGIRTRTTIQPPFAGTFTADLRIEENGYQIPAITKYATIWSVLRN